MKNVHEMTQPESGPADEASERRHQDKKHALFVRQKKLLDQFLSTGAISKAQYDKSLNDLRAKMNEE